MLASLARGPAGFSELARSVNGISDSVLSDRLSELPGAGLVQRTVEPGPPITVAYALTPAGEALAPALDALATWASEHLLESPPAER